MGDWKWAYGSAATVGAVALGQVIAPGTRGLGVALLAAAVLLALLGSLRVRAWTAERVGRLRSDAWWKWTWRNMRRRGYAAYVFVDIVPAPGAKLPPRTLERHQITTQGTGRRWVGFQMQPRALHFARPVNRVIGSGQFPYELLSWQGRVTIVRIMPEGMLIDDHGIKNIVLDLEVEPLQALTPVAQPSRQRTKRDPSPPPPSSESEGTG